MALQVIVVQLARSGVKERLEGMLRDCQETLRFEGPFWHTWDDPPDVNRISMEDPAFWILEVPVPRDNTKRAAFEELLKELDERPRAWVYVISPQEQFNSEEASHMWLGHRCVIHYDLWSHLNPSELKALLGELLERSSLDYTKRFPIGRRLEMPAEEYEAHKFVSLFLGGMRPVLWEVKRFLQALEEISSREHLEKHPFLRRPKGGEPQLRNPQELFDEIVGRPSDEKPSVGKGIPDWMRKLSEQATLTLPHLLILGETGTGKTLLARFLHRYRFQHLGGITRNLDALLEAEQRLIELIFQELNCGAISESLLEGELFGAKAGAWTDLRENRPGKIFCSLWGTLFLDEIGSLPLSAQAALLKYLDNYKYKPINWEGEAFFVPAVVIAATNQPLERLVEEGKFRRDLFGRFRFRIRLPSLKERMDHFEELVDFVLQNPRINPVIDKAEGNEGKRRVNSISEEALQRLKQHDWPGNFRELEQVLWRAVDAAWEEGLDILLPRHLPL